MSLILISCKFLVIDISNQIDAYRCENICICIQTYTSCVVLLLFSGANLSHQQACLYRFNSRTSTIVAVLNGYDRSLDIP